MRATRGAAYPTSPLNTIIRSTSTRSGNLRGFIMTEEENKLARLESLVANVDFDDQALNILGFHTEHLGWVQFSNGVSVNTHKGFALEILTTMTHILDEGVPSLSFHLEEVEQVVPYEY
jgi:hypothetical protein